jgi:mannose-6-phosphate isomerase
MDPFFSPRPWGGDRLRSMLGKRLPASPGPFGESWELSDHPAGLSRVANGPAIGMAFGDLLRRHPREMLGVDRAPDRYPLMIKYIDAAENLSVQVHPDDAAARSLGERGKVECWHVIDAPPGAEIIHGVRPGVTVPMLRQAALGGDFDSMLRRLPVRPGQVVIMPPGVVHALLAHIMVCEIQQASDLTYRLWDWNRRPPRPMHVEAACAVARVDAEAAPAPVALDPSREGSWQPMVKTEFFEVDAAAWRGGARAHVVTLNPNGLALNVVGGQGIVQVNGCPAEPMRLGQTWFVPAGLEDWSLEAGREGLRLLVSRSLEIAG